MPGQLEQSKSDFHNDGHEEDSRYPTGAIRLTLSRRALPLVES